MDLAAVYAPLPSCSFRLLTILPSSPSDPSLISCQLSTHPLSSAPPYTALSYTWGSHRNPLPVQLGNNCFPVRQNLHQALTHIRINAKGNPVTLWADAICINQDDPDERTDQVRQMHTIYTNASDVLVWLGPSSPDSSAALDFVLELPDLLTEAKRAGSAKSQKVLNDPSLQDRWHALGRLLTRPWWRRVWIIQEISLARSARLLVGTHSIPWSSMYALLSELKHSWQWALHTKTEPDVATIIRLASTSRSIFDIAPSLAAHGHTADLGALLKITHLFKSTDPRDKIYALLGLTDAHTQHHIQPDYRKSTVNAYRDTFTYLYARNRDLGDLSWITGQSVILYQTDPSWVPNFQSDNANFSLSWTVNNPDPWLDDIGVDGGHEIAKSRKIYAAGDPALAGVQPVAPKFAGSVMNLPGVQFDTIVELDMYKLFDLLEYSHNRITETQVVEKLKTEADTGEGADLPYIAGGSSRMAFYRTLLLDCDIPYINPGTGSPQRLPKPTLDVKSSKDTPSPIPIPPKSASEVDVLLHKIQGSLAFFYGRCFAMTSTGYMGVVPRTAKPGDWVCVLLGGELPFVIRKVGDGFFRLVGECYLQGIMDGEVMEGVRRGKNVLRDIAIR